MFFILLNLLPHMLNSAFMSRQICVRQWLDRLGGKYRLGGLFLELEAVFQENEHAPLVLVGDLVPAGRRRT